MVNYEDIMISPIFPGQFDAVLALVSTLDKARIFYENDNCLLGFMKDIQDSKANVSKQFLRAHSMRRSKS